MTDVELVTLVVVESGAEWPTWAAHVNRAAPTNLVETEVLGETEAEFRARVLGRLSRLHDRGTKLAAAAYVAAPSPRRRELRAQISESILEQMVPGAEFLLAGGYPTPPVGPHPGRAELLELWQKLSERGAPQLISLRFNDAPDRASGLLSGDGGRGSGSTVTDGWG
jgi:hypothetical protein